MPFDPYGKGTFMSLGPHMINKSILKLKSPSGILTSTELEALNLLEKIIDNALYRIFTQIHISQLIHVDKDLIQSALNKNHVKQDLKEKYATDLFNFWRYKLGQKSVDFLITDKKTTKARYAIEIDGPSHNDPEQQEWDEIKDRCFKMAKIPLVRFKNQDVPKNASSEEVVEFKLELDKKLADADSAIKNFHRIT